MIQIIKRISELQLHYTSSNSAEMQERGKLIRKELPQALSSCLSDYKKALGGFSSDFAIEGSDGIGRKTQAPWVRLFSKSLSPSATTGFYVVIHFSIDGERCYVTIGCGATTWDKEAGDLKKTPGPELDKQVLWALQELEKSSKKTELFPDFINIGSTKSLPRAFERATVIAKCFTVSTLKQEVLQQSLIDALELLSIIYESCSQGKSLNTSEVHEADIEWVVNPNKKTLATRQGYGLSGPERKAVELRAMEVTRLFLEKEGYKCTDTSSNKPYDFLATNNEQEIKIEVKGTTNQSPDSVLMTSNEVELHKTEQGNTALSIVHSINFITRGDNAEVEGGILEYLSEWNILDWEIKPTAYLVKRPDRD
jgi:hypothetical protein